LSKRDADSGVGKHERRLLQYRRLAYMERAQMPHPFGNPHYHHCLQTLVNPVLTTHLRGWEKKRQIGRVLQPQSGQGKPYFLAKVVMLVEYKIQTLPL